MRDIGSDEPEYFASTSRRSVNCRTSSDGMASMATSLVCIDEGSEPSVKSFNAAYMSESSFECRVRLLGRDLGRAVFVVDMSFAKNGRWLVT